MIDAGNSGKLVDATGKPIPQTAAEEKPFAAIQTAEGQPQYPITQAEFQRVMLYAGIHNKVLQLPEEEQQKIQQCIADLQSVMDLGGDAARVALQMFTATFDNSQHPYGDHFDVIQTPTVEDAFKLWFDVQGIDLQVGAA